MRSEGPDEASRCARCGTEFPGRTSPLGLCPACLLKLGMSDPALPPPPVDPSEREPEPAAAERAVPAPAVSRSSRRPHPRWLWTAAALAGLLVLLSAVRYLVVSIDSPRPSASVVRFSLALPDDTAPASGAQVAVSPDGERIVVAARGPEGRQRLWLRTLSSTEWRVLAQTEGAAFPFWSPDSRQIGFFASRRLKRIEVSNGLTSTVCDAPDGRGGAWTSEGVIVFAPGAAGPLLRVPAAGGTPEQVTALDESELAHLWPHVLQNPDQVTHVSAGRPSNEDQRSGASVTSLSRGTVRRKSFSSGERVTLVAGAGPAAFAQGFLLFVRGSSLVAQPYDPDQAGLRGSAQLISGAEQLDGSPMSGFAFSVSDHVLVYRAGGPSSSLLVWLDRDGRQLDAAGEPSDLGGISLSPDGSRVAAVRRDERDGSSNIWTVDVRRRITSRVTIGRATDTSPVWSPDGARIAFVSDRSGAPGIYVAAADGGGKEEVVLESAEPRHLTDWSPDGRMLLYSTSSPETGSDLWALPLDGDRKPEPIGHTRFNESQGRMSPDGRWLAYVSDESGQDEVFVRTFPSSDGRWQVSIDGGALPRWGRDGRELFFVSQGQMMAAGIESSGPAIRPLTPRPLFATQDADDYQVSPDGSRFLVKMPVRAPGASQLQVVLNWASELQR